MCTGNVKALVSQHICAVLSEQSQLGYLEPVHVKLFKLHSTCVTEAFYYPIKQ